MSALAEQPLQRKPPSGLLEPLESPRPATLDPDLPIERFLNRELSWLDFNARVLELAEDELTLPLERAKFLAIFATNLDEFFMVRVAGLKRRAAARLQFDSPDGLSTREQLERISARAAELVERHATCWRDSVGPQLRKAGIRIVHWGDLGPRQLEELGTYFRQHIFPVLTPLAVDPAHPFPYISGLSLNLGVMVRVGDSVLDATDRPESGSGPVERFARVKVPPNVPRLVRVDTASEQASGQAGDQASDATADGDAAILFVPLEEIITAHLRQLFPGMDVVDSVAFRVTRNQELEVEEDEAEDLLQALERELARRRFGRAVRLEIQGGVDSEILEMLVRELEVDRRDVYEVPGGLLDLSTLWALQDLDRPDLKDPPRVPVTHPRLSAGEGEPPPDFFSVLREGDVFVHHPYDSFTTSVQRFIEQAAADPHVLAIKQTLYRTSGDSPIVEALIDAAEAGKQVVVLVEIKARFDETANIKWARALERAGCHVVYGLIGLKTHCKAALVVRQERGRLRRYCHLGTGNYNPKTARLYEDLGLLTSDPDVGADLTDLFNVLTGYSRQTEYRTLLVAPQRMRESIVERIGAEARAAQAGQPCGIRLKANALVDEEVIDALYRASRAGVPVECLIRGICALRPGVPGLSETVTVRSILGRYLEHSRVIHFQSAGEWWIGSADMMHRNLDRRIESLVRVRDALMHDQLSAMLDLAFSSHVVAWDLDAKGQWTRTAYRGDRRLLDYQAELAAITALTAANA